MFTKRYVASVPTLCVTELFIIVERGKLEITQMSTNSIIYKQNMV